MTPAGAARARLVASLVAVLVAAVGCSGSGDEPTEDAGPPDVEQTAASQDAWVTGYCEALVPVREREAEMAAASDAATPDTYPAVMGAEFAEVGAGYLAAAGSLAEVGGSPEPGGGTVHETVVTGLHDAGTAYVTWSEQLLALPDDIDPAELATEVDALYDTWSPAIQAAGEQMTSVLTADLAQAVGTSASCSGLFG